MRLKKLSEQVIVITGASSGIGRATAKMAARRGAHVVLTARSGPELQKVVEEIARDNGSASSHVADVTIPHQLEALAELVEKERAASTPGSTTRVSALTARSSNSGSMTCAG
jgi:NAD(P)-dependent dehydrogenase (short-subunit alcohol dehydrogenase family)